MSLFIRTLIISLKNKEVLKATLLNWDNIPTNVRNNILGLITFKRLLLGKSWDKCEDCNRRLPKYLLKEYLACADSHSGGYPCCWKSICKLGCYINCSNCNKRNYFTTTIDYEGYADHIHCWNCKEYFQVEVKYWNDLKESCRRYCNCGIDKLDRFIIDGFREQKDIH